jgi:hypothetical protein
MGRAFLGLMPFQLVALLAAVMTLAVLADALAGHARSGFARRSQYAPFVSGGLLVLALGAAAVFPGSAWAHRALDGAGWLAILSGIAGFGFHHYYGIARKPGGYGWPLHYLMYGAPPLAPLALTALGALGLVAARGLAGEATALGWGLPAVLIAYVAVALAGAIAQAGVLHYRGAFNNPAMYAPLGAPLLAVLASVWVLARPGPVARASLSVLLALTALTGFVGLGMHLRGFDRQAGGLHVALFNLLEGPPAWAPALFSGIGAIGLIALHLLA